MNFKKTTLFIAFPLISSQ